MIDLGVDEFYPEEDGVTVYAPYESFGTIQKWLDDNNYEIVSGEGAYLPTDTKELDAVARESVEKLVERLEGGRRRGERLPQHEGARGKRSSSVAEPRMHAAALRRVSFARTDRRLFDTTERTICVLRRPLRIFCSLVRSNPDSFARPAPRSFRLSSARLPRVFRPREGEGPATMRLLAVHQRVDLRLGLLLQLGGLTLRLLHELVARLFCGDLRQGFFAPSTSFRALRLGRLHEFPARTLRLVAQLLGCLTLQFGVQLLLLLLHGRADLLLLCLYRLLHGRMPREFLHLFVQQVFAASFAASFTPSVIRGAVNVPPMPTSIRESRPPVASAGSDTRAV